MKKETAKKLHLGKITIASLSKQEQQRIQGGIPTPTAPIICIPTRRPGCHWAITRICVVKDFTS